MVEVRSSEEDLRKMLAAMQPPATPAEIFRDEYPDVISCRRWHKPTAAAQLGGLQTDARFHANGTRFDWLLRLVLSYSSGIHRPTRHELSTVMNVGLARAGVLSSEDPNEDLFCELIATKRGGFRILAGQWESAGAYTQTLLDAFESLPDDPMKSVALTKVYALLRLSDEVADRAAVDGDTSPGGTPMGEIELPSPSELRQLANRVSFTTAELTKLDITTDILASFVLTPDLFPHVCGRPVGDTPLEFRPLLQTPKAIVLVSPQNVSTAVRLTLIQTALRGGMGDAFQEAILREQEELIYRGRFWPASPIPFFPPDRHFMRAFAAEYEPGRYLQVIQVPARLDDFSRGTFATIRPLSPDAAKSLADHIELFWDFIGRQEDVRASATVVVMSGWGGGQTLAPPIDHERAPDSWQFLAATFAEIFVMGVVRDMVMTDVLRVMRQCDRLSDDGFEFVNMSGTLNLLGFWRDTGGNLIPEHLLDVQPPLLVAIPTDALLPLRIECVHRRGVRLLPLPQGGATVVERMERSDEESVQPIYVSEADVSAFHFSAAVVKDARVWWIDLGTAPPEGREWLYRCLRAAAQWVDAVGEAVANKFAELFPAGARRVRVLIPTQAETRLAFDSNSFSVPLSAALAIKQTSEGGVVEVLPEWIPYLSKRENQAEVALTAAIFKCLALPSEASPSVAELRGIVLDTVGSPDWRWLHALHTTHVEDRLTSAELIAPFQAIPYSAHALVRCGSVWSFRDRTLGGEIDGKEECLAFILKYYDEMVRSLISDMHRFDRAALCVIGAKRYQEARAEQTLWRNTIRAMRAVHGTSGEAYAIKHQFDINGAMRAAKVVCEIAACEAPASGAQLPSRTEVDEMFAKALLILGNGQLYSAIMTDLIPATIRISPAGDLVASREPMTSMFSPGVEWITRKRFDEAAEEYGLHDDDDDDPKRQPFDAALRRALETEYGVSAEAFFDLQHALAALAEERNAPVLELSRSELARWLAEYRRFRSREPLPLLERLTLTSRSGWFDLSSGLGSADIDIGKFDRPWSLINRPLLALDNSADPKLVLSPVMAADACRYSLWGLVEGRLNERYWVSAEARRFSGTRGKASGDAFENELVARLRELGLEVIPRCKLSFVLNQKVPHELGDVDAIAITPDRKRVWVIEAKNLRLCRSESEAASRMYEYRGDFIADEQGRQRPDKMLRHLRRVRYLRQHRDRLAPRLKLPVSHEILGLLIVESPQPMNVWAANSDPDARCVFLDTIGDFPFFEGR
jgi:hypothetical protein